MIRRILPVFLLLFILIVNTFGPAGAQDGQPSGPVYVVQAGDTLWEIALRFGVSMDSLQRANGLSDPGQIKAGDELIIPGMEGIQGKLVTTEIGFGESLRSLSRRYRVPISTLAQLNHLATPFDLYVGKNLVIPESSSQDAPVKRIALASGESLLELAILQGSDPWSIASGNEISSTWSILPGDVMQIPGGEAAGPGSLPPEISAVSLTTMMQGKTAVLHVSGQENLQLSGSVLGFPLHFFPVAPGEWVALDGVYAMQNPGLYPLELKAGTSGDQEFQFVQSVYVNAGDFLQDVPITVDPAGLDPAVTRPEDEEWSALAAPATAEKMWSGAFQFPAEKVYSDCFPSTFGRRRSYNGSPYNYFHTGLDVCGGVGDDIYAAASGVVVFAGKLTVRGNATMIDHGWGVYTAYMHQSEILVKPGDRVEAGQLIGRVGRTGLRITGPHLHFEVLVGGVQVDPSDWLNQEYP
jgi:murein DD-endopeptidase MepM/ murein hydrolase activator NlpD